MSVRCQVCGTEQGGGKFCAQCGSPLPQQVPGGGLGWIKWAAGGVAVVAVAGAAVFFAGNLGKPAQTGPQQPPQQQPPQQQTQQPPQQQSPPQEQKPAQPQPEPKAGAKVSLVAKGQLDAKPSYAGAFGPYLAVAVEPRATLYEFDAQGVATPVGQVVAPDAGGLLDTTVGDLNNDGTPEMITTFWSEIWVTRTDGESTSTENDGSIIKVLIGDYDGDGKNETIFLEEDGFEVWRFLPGESGQMLYRKTDLGPLPHVVQTQQKAGETNLLFGYVREEGKLFIVLCGWSAEKGPVAVGKYEIADTAEAPAQWIASGPTAVGPTLLVSRGFDSTASLEVMTVARDAKSTDSLGSMKLGGVGAHAIMISKFTGQEGQILTVDDGGSYALYNISPD